MNTSDIQRWKKDLDEFIKASKLLNMDDVTSVQDTVTKRIIWAKVLAKDAYNLKAIVDLYHKTFCEAIDEIETDLNFFKESMTQHVSEKTTMSLLDIVFSREIVRLFYWINSLVIMLISLVEMKLAEEKEISKQGEKLRRILEEERKTSKDRKNTYVV